MRQIVDGIEALDPERRCAEYWQGKAHREAAAAGHPCRLDSLTCCFRKCAGIAAVAEAQVVPCMLNVQSSLVVMPVCGMHRAPG